MTSVRDAQPGSAEPVTPLFRLIRPPTPRGDGEANLAAAVPGQCRLERIVLASCFLPLILAAGFDRTEGISGLWLRIPASVAVSFVLLHVIMIGLAAIVPFRNSVRQAWLFMCVATVYAAIRWMGPGSGGVFCLPWLILLSLNAAAAFVSRIAGRRPMSSP